MATKTKRVSATVRMRRDLYELTKACADSAGMSFSVFAQQAIASYVRNWEDPVHLEPVGRLRKRAKSKEPFEGWVCTHQSHGEIPAPQCKHRFKQVHQQEMFHPETQHMGWVDPEQADG